MKMAQVARRLGMDIALWYCAPVAFLFAYVYGFAAPRLAIWPHLLIVTLPFVALILLRFALARIPWKPVLMRLVAALIAASLLTLLLLYYAFVLVGLRSWGGVVAWGVISTGFQQAPELADAIGFPSMLAVIVLGALFVAVVAACAWYFKHFDWTVHVAGRMSDFTVALLVLFGGTAVAAETGQFWAEPWVHASEPVSLTLFPMADARELEGHPMDPLATRNLDRLEDVARAAYTTAAASVKRNVILIVVDALRADHMGLYGYARDTTPNLNRLAQTRLVRPIRGVHASCGDTICGLLSISMSKVARKFSFHPFSLQEVLRRNGYRVHMILSGDHTHFYSLKRYYGPVDSFFDGTQAQGYFMNDDQFLVDRVAAMPEWDGVPVLFQFHVMSSHVLRKIDEVPGPYQPASRYMFQESRDTGPGGVKLQTATNFYDNGVRKTDSVVSDLLNALEHRGFLRNALVVITADHGESLGEHGLFVHANSLREEVLRIPLVLISFGYEPERTIAPRNFASQIDIAPTILAELGLPAPLTWMGQPLQEPDSGGFACTRTSD